jgi:hydroxymethylpyrimidine kinase/phosphomethylpyrimidine kinase
MKLIILSPPTLVPNEHQVVVDLLEAGLERFHLRKPGFSDLDYATYLASIPMKFWSRIVLHGHHELAVQLGLGGIHWTEQSKKGKSKIQLQQLAQDYRAEGLHISAAIHDLKDLNMVGDICDYVLISPVFDSISKPDYSANSELGIQNWSRKISADLIALGGISTTTARQAIAKGFDGVAALGFIWESVDQAVERFQQLEKTLQNIPQAPTLSVRPYVLSIAGHDPSAGAGLSADLKTFEQWQTYGLSVCTALTIQTDRDFKSVHWVEDAVVLEQLSVLLNRFEVKVVKVGLVKNWLLLENIIDALNDQEIILDPILSASAGFDFHSESSQATFQQILPKLTLLTPNREEILKVIPNASSPEDAAAQLSQHCAILLKGGHHNAALGRDELWKDGACVATFEAQQIAKSGKHGSGCVLSASIAAALAKGKELATACEEAKRYIEVFLSSNDELLGYHA